MTFFYVLFSVYILAVNFYGFRFLKEQRDAAEAGEQVPGDGKLLLAALLGGSVAIYAAMFCMKYRLGSLALMLVLPLLSVFNLYCFFLGFRGIYLFL